MLEIRNVSIVATDFACVGIGVKGDRIFGLKEGTCVGVQAKLIEEEGSD